MIPGVRPAVERFAEAMEAVLRTHDDRTWDREPTARLLRRLHEEVAELDSAFTSPVGLVPSEMQAWRNDIRHEAVDVANFAMMIYDVMTSRQEPETPAAHKAAKVRTT